MSFFHPAHRPIYRSGTSAAKDGENFETKTLMKTNAFIKLGQITILTTIVTTSILPLAQASSFDSSNTKRDAASSTMASHRVLKASDQKHRSEKIQFNTIDGEPLN